MKNPSTLYIFLDHNVSAYQDEYQLCVVIIFIQRTNKKKINPLPFPNQLSEVSVLFVKVLKLMENHFMRDFIKVALGKIFSKKSF